MTAGSPNETPPLWSVVVIARNEAAVIDRSLAAIVLAMAGRSHEILLVDSDSTDGTIEIAARHPVGIVRLDPRTPKRPSVGRWVGFRLTRGELVLFVDGDSIVSREWVDEAETTLRARPELAGVDGWRQEVLGQERDLLMAPTSLGAEPPHLMGTALLRRAAIERAGGMNPFLSSCEEAELAARLRKAGYRLWRLERPMAWHERPEKPETIPELFRRMRRGFPLGTGQFVRTVLANRLPVENAPALVSRHVGFFTWMVVGVACFAWGLAAANWRPLAGWASILALAFGLFALRAGNLRKPTYYFAEWLFSSPMVVRGLLQRPKGPADFARFAVVHDWFRPIPTPRAGTERLSGEG